MIKLGTGYQECLANAAETCGKEISTAQSSSSTHWDMMYFKRAAMKLAPWHE
jgi:hypothetical protein